LLHYVPRTLSSQLRQSTLGYFLTFLNYCARVRHIT